MELEGTVHYLTCSINMQFSPEMRDEALRLLLSGVGPIETTPGCLSCTVEQDALDINRVSFSEKWESKKPFEQHIQSELFRRILSAMDLSQESPQVTIGNLSGFSGIAYLRELYEGGKSTIENPTKGK